MDERCLILSAAVSDCDAEIPDYLKRFTTAEAALYLLATVRTERQRLAEIEALLEAECARRMPSQRVELPGMVAERKGGKDRKAWRHADLASAVVTGYLTDDDGLIADDDSETAQTARDVERLLLDCAGIAYWKTTALRALGIDPDVYCDSTPGRRTVHITVGDPTEPVTSEGVAA